MKVKLSGVVVRKNSTNATVKIERIVKHKIYGKQYKISKNIRAFDPESIAEIGNVVTIEETRPISKTMHFKIIK